MVFHDHNIMTAEEALHNYYKKGKCSQPEIAAQLLVSQASVHNWLSGKKKIPMESYPAISRLCGVSLLQLLPHEWINELG